MAFDDLKLTFRDEFNSLSLDTGTAATDANFWNTSMYDGTVRSLDGNGELQWYMDADYKGSSSTPLGVNPFEINNGVLSIKARPASTDVHNAIWGYNYTSGVLTSAHEFSQQYGYFEVRAQVPEGQGLWPAFWLLSDDGTWPPELDVMEVIGNQTNYVHQSMHTGAGTNNGQATWNSEKLSAGFHTYGMDWTASTITFYLDGKPTVTMATPSDLNAPMYMVLNLAVGGNWPGSPDGTTNWATANYNIDYVRVYQHTGVAGSGGVLSASDGAEIMGPTIGPKISPITLSALVTASNGIDMASGARYIAADTGANSSRTYTAADLGLSGIPSSATMTVSYGAQNDVTVTNNGAWNDIKNATVTSSTLSAATVNNFVAVQIAMNSDQNSTVHVTAAKRGQITTGAGNDTINVSALSDTNDINMMTIAAGDGANQVTFNGAANTRTTITTGSGADRITVTGAAGAAIQAGGGADIIRGGGGNDVINGGDGDDRILATVNDGNDTVTGGNGWDMLWYLDVPGAVSINQFDGIVHGSAGDDILADVFEQIVGSNYNDILAGGNGVNCIDGMGGDDQFWGNGGTDLLRGQDGNDTFRMLTNDGDDQMMGGDGFDTLSYAPVAGPVSVNLMAGTTAGSAGNDTLLDSFEQVIGTAFADIIAGDNNANTLQGGGGNDRLYGNGGNDTLKGDDGDDWLSGGAGDNTLTGGAGSDVFAFIAGAHATITDFNAAEDSIQLTGGVTAANLTVRTSGNSTLLDLNGNTVMTLTGTIIPASAIHFS